MNCNCITEVNNKIKDATGDPESNIDMLYQFGETIKKMPYITYSYRKKKKDGSFNKAVIQGKLALSRCPICGIKIKP